MTMQLSPHQTTASGAAVSEFDTADRASIIMPCGTGKTLVGIDVVRQLQPTKLTRAASICSGFTRAQQDHL